MNNKDKLIMFERSIGFPTIYFREVNQLSNDIKINDQSMHDNITTLKSCFID
ncbi:hypothetical protein Hanom_Chr02g00147931 [Helianthus anomalus]